MKIDKTKERMSALLDGTVEHFNMENRCLDGQKCFYIPPDDTSTGCAIGRHLPVRHKKLAGELDDAFNNPVKLRRLLGGNPANTNVKYLFDLFEKRGLNVPLVFKGMTVNFLMKIQQLHDDPSHWNTDGISECGERVVKKLKLEYNLL
jgi:hypothetical protein